MKLRRSIAVAAAALALAACAAQGTNGGYRTSSGLSWNQLVPETEESPAWAGGTQTGPSSGRLNLPSGSTSTGDSGAPR